jgi:hypothetical protein
VDALSWPGLRLPAFGPGKPKKLCGTGVNTGAIQTRDSGTGPTHATVAGEQP